MILTTLILLSSASGASDILMLGNSYTSYNQLNMLVQQVFEAGADTSSVVALTGGGLTLSDHASLVQDKSSAWYTELVTNKEQWDWVVLQDQSQIPGFPTTNSDWQASLAGAESLNTQIEEGGGETLFFLTWGRRDGDSYNAARYEDFSTMQALLTEGYTAYAAATSTKKRPTWIAPVGLAFAHVHDDIVLAGDEPTDPDSLFYLLYVEDGSHPSSLGSYLAACVFYATVTGKSTVGLSAPKSIDPKWVSTLQQAADMTVFEETDTLDYPWEETSTTDTAPPNETDEPTGWSGTTWSDTSDTATPSDSVSDAVESEDAAGGCGCDHSLPNPVGFVSLALVSIGLVRRQNVVVDCCVPVKFWQ